MKDDARGLPTALNKGDYVIVSTGAIATSLDSYPAGYEGLVALSLDGEVMHDEAGSLIPHDPAASADAKSQSEPFVSAAGTENLTKMPSARMAD